MVWWRHEDYSFLSFIPVISTFRAVRASFVLLKAELKNHFELCFHRNILERFVRLTQSYKLFALCTHCVFVDKRTDGNDELSRHKQYIQKNLRVSYTVYCLPLSFTLTIFLLFARLSINCLWRCFPNQKEKIFYKLK